MYERRSLLQIHGEEGGGRWWKGLTEGQHVHAALSCAGLVALVATERLTLKLMVDRMEPFRYILVQAVALCYFLSVGLVVLRKMHHRDITPEMESFPKRKLLLMALLDLFHLVPMVVCAAAVAPTLTVILLQASMPFSMIISRVFTRRRYSWTHVAGSMVILLAAALGMFLPVFHLVAGEDRGGGSGRDAAQIEGYNTLVFVLGCVPAATSTVYKQVSLIGHALPMDAYYLNLMVVSMELVLILLTLPLAYHLQALGGEGSLYPSAMITPSLRDGWQCLVLMKDVQHPEWYPVQPRCKGALPLVLAYVACTLLVNTFVQKVMRVAEGMGVYHWTITVSMLAAFLVLAVYSAYDERPQTLHDSVNVFTILSLAVLMAGMELYHAREEPDAEVLTDFRPTPNADSGVAAAAAAADPLAPREDGGGKGGYAFAPG